MKPKPHQIEGARFLAGRTFAVLADEPRVGKTGAAIMAADMLLARRVLVITTASGRAVWRQAFAAWAALPGKAAIANRKRALETYDPRAVIVGWPDVSNPSLLAQLLAGSWDVLIVDEAHYAKSFDAARTRAVFGAIDADGDLDVSRGIAARATRVWCLTGTPMPNSPFDLFPMLRFGAPERIPDSRAEKDFRDRYCTWRPKKVSRWLTVPVITGGRNLDELSARIDGLSLRRTQADVGIMPPVYETFPLLVPERARRDADAASAQIMEAIDAGTTRELDMHLGPLRRLTGRIKAEALVDAVVDEMECGLDKIVLAYWHREVGDILADKLGWLGVSRIDGATPPDAREAAVAAFNGPNRVFLAQIQAAGEAIDLSAASELIFVEMSFIPKDGQQMALRVTNLNQNRQPRVRVAAIAGSVDEAVQTVLLRKMQAIREVLTK